jgi:hypothetical protein
LVPVDGERCFPDCNEADALCITEVPVQLECDVTATNGADRILAFVIAELKYEECGGSTCRVALCSADESRPLIQGESVSVLFDPTFDYMCGTALKFNSDPIVGASPSSDTTCDSDTFSNSRCSVGLGSKCLRPAGLKIALPLQVPQTSGTCNIDDGVNINSIIDGGESPYRVQVKCGEALITLNNDNLEPDPDEGAGTEEVTYYSETTPFYFEFLGGELCSDGYTVNVTDAKDCSNTSDPPIATVEVVSCGIAE